MDKESSYIKSIISSIQPLPPRVQKFGNVEVAWWENEPGNVTIAAIGGISIDDRFLAEDIVEAQLDAFGYKRSVIHVADVNPVEILDREKTEAEQPQQEDDGQRKREKTRNRQESWNEVQEKAQNLVQQGSVSIIHNTSTKVEGSVLGNPHNDRPRRRYRSAFTRESPDSPVLKSWSCFIEGSDEPCPWFLYNRDRTRQYKHLEGRPCSHTTALWMASKSAPLEEIEPFAEGAPEAPTPPAPTPPGPPSPFAQQPGAPGPEGMPGGVVPSVPEGPRGLQQLTPFKPEDVGAMDPNEILEQRLGPLAPVRQQPMNLEEQAQQQEMLAPMPERNIQTPPLEQLKEMQRLEQPPAAPGQSPFGQAAPFGTVSVPGARMPNERNPMTLPNTFSKVITKSIVIGMNENFEYKTIKTGSKGKPVGYDPATGLVEVLFKSANVRCYVNSDDLEIN